MRPPASLFIAICGTFFSCAANGQSASFQKKVDEYMTRYVRNGDFSGNLLVVKNDSILFSRAYGKADYALNIPMKRDQKFRVASISKTFTAAAIIILKNEGAIKFNDKLSQFIPGFINGDSINILQLLLHQSGVADIRYDQYALDNLSLAEAIATIKDKPLYFKPGSQSRYSNSGYLLLSAIIEKVSGMSYEEFLKKQIFLKLGMNNTGVDHCNEIIPNKATGYSVGNGANGITMAAWYDINLETGSGSLYSTVDDLLKWVKAIKNKTLFDITNLPYPFGWGTREYFSGIKSIEQSGFLSGYSSYIGFYQSENLIVIGLSNISSNFNEQSGKDIAAIYFQKEYELPEIRKDIPGVDFSRYTGKYTWPGYKDFFIEQKGHAIYWRFTDEKTGQPLSPISQDNFLLRVFNNRIVFNPDTGGTISSLTFQSGSSKTTCSKIGNVAKE